MLELGLGGWGLEGGGGGGLFRGFRGFGFGV